MADLRAGDVDYEALGHSYSTHRRTDAHIAAHIHEALGSARTVLNVGAGAGSYEPEGRYVLAVEPSASMRAQRPPSLAPAINARAEALPLDDRAVDASMAVLTVHQWADYRKGLSELRRVTRGPIVLLVFDEALASFWLHDYVPELLAVERRHRTIDAMCDALGPGTDVRHVPVPRDCADGFTESFYARPERFLDPGVRRSQSVWKFVGADVEERFITRLGEDLRSGRWDRQYGQWRTMPFFDGALRLVVRR